jgi:hypothetical protein
MPRSGYILPPAIRLMFADGLEPVLSGLLTTTLLPFSVNTTVPAALTPGDANQGCLSPKGQLERGK